MQFFSDLRHLALSTTTFVKIVMRMLLLIIALGIGTEASAQEGTCRLTGNINHWSSGYYIFDCTMPLGNEVTLDIPQQLSSYRIEVYWGGRDKTGNGDSPRGSIKLTIGSDRSLSGQRKRGTGDRLEDWTWEGSTSVQVPADTQQRLTVSHATSNSTAVNTFLRVKFMGKD